MLGFLKKLTGNADDSFTAKITPFSEKPENKALAAQARSLTGLKEDFASDFLTGSPEQGVTTSIRHQAEYSHNDKFWYLVEIKRFQGGGLDGLFKRDIQARTKHPFDALHYCAEFQTFGEKNGLRAVDLGAPYWRNMRHWRDGAKELNLPIAENGMILLPQKDGAVLPSGYFREEQILSAQQSFKRTAEPVDLKKLRRGYTYGDKGVFIGFMDLEKNWGSKELTDPRNMVAIFAAPKDLKMPDGKTNLCGTFNEQADRVKALRNWHGHDGEQLKAPNFFNNYRDRLTKRLKELKEGEGTGWYIGFMSDNNFLIADIQDTGNLRGTFAKKTEGIIGAPWCYWTNRVQSSRTYYCDLSIYNIFVDECSPDSGMFSVRPMRAERLILPK